MRYPFLNLKPVNAKYEEALKAAACKVIESGRYINGDNVERLEIEIANICASKYAVAVSNGLDALKLILLSYKELGLLSDGDEILLQANTFIASALAISDAGLKPKLVDISASTLNIDTESLEKYISPRTRGIMPVHLYGTPCWDNTLKKIAQKHNLIIIEDNAQAIGATANGEGLNGTHNTGSLGNAAGMSFYPTKNVGALGDAGIVTTNDELLAKTVRTLANYGSDRRYHNIYKGLNCRMDELQAAMLLVKLPYLNEENERRRNLAKIYNDNINNPEITTPKIFDDMVQVWHQYPLRVRNREKFCEYMELQGIATDIIYPNPIHKAPCYEKEYANITLAEAEKFAKEVVCLPIGAHITLEDGLYISNIANKFNK